MLLALAAQAVLPAEWAQLLQQQQAAAGRPAAPAFAQAMQPPQWPFPAQAQQPAQNPMAMMAALMGDYNHVEFDCRAQMKLMWFPKLGREGPGLDRADSSWGFYAHFYGDWD